MLWLKKPYAIQSGTIVRALQLHKRKFPRWKSGTQRNDAIKGHAIPAIDRLDETHIMKRTDFSLYFSA
jgi:hypothetical protein